jgi:hypothetical protein
MRDVWRKIEFAGALGLARQSALEYRIDNDPEFPEPFGTSPDGSVLYWCPDEQPEVVDYVARKVSQGRGRMRL